MTYTASAPADGSVDTSGRFNGIPVELRSLTPSAALKESREQDAPGAGTAPELLAYAPPTYLIGKHDVISVAIWEHPELTMPFGQYRTDNAVGQTVDDSGQFFFPFMGAVKAEGVTTSALRRTMQTALSRYLTNPQLDVKVTGFRSQKAFVSGSVVKPGPVELTDVPTSVLDAISQAGGLTTGADPKRVELRRDGKTYMIDVDGSRQRGTDAHRVLLKDGDNLRVPFSDENKVYVLGEVERQSALPVVGRLSLVNALASSGGLNLLSSRSRGIYVIRGDESPRIQVWHLDARNPLAFALADKFPLKPGDLIYVDATNLANWNRMMTLLLSTSSFLNQSLGSAVDVQSLTR